MGDPVSFRARLLGQLIRQLRDARGLTLKYVAAYLGVEFSLVSRFERGEWPFTRDRVAALLDVYGCYEQRHRERVLRLAEAVWRSRAEIDFDGAVPDESFADLLWMEAEAVTIQCFSPTGIPVLLHTAEFAEHHIRAVLGGEVLPEQVDAGLRLHERRQQVWHRQPQPVRVEVVVDECVLHPAGTDSRLWAVQLVRLQHLAESPNVLVRVIPVGASRPPQLVGGFTVFTLTPPCRERVVHIEYLGGRLFLDDARHVDAHLHLFDQMVEQSVDLAAYTPPMPGQRSVSSPA